MTTSTQRTLFAVDLALAQLFGENYTCLPNTTLNEKFGILPGENVPEGKYPTLQYIAIGIGGTGSIVSADNYVYSEHSPIDGALFKHIPFIMKKLDEDLDEVSRMNYRFRKEETHNGETYACYYLKKIPANMYDQKFFKVTNINGQSYLKNYKLNDPKILNPVPRDRNISYDTVDQTEFVTKLSRFKLELNSTEMKELDKVYKILGYEHRKLTEIGLCTGIDVITGSFGEATCVQMAFHFDMNLDLTYSINSNSSLVKYIELGGSEALIY